MKGLIKKDLYLIKGNLKTLIVIFAVFILMSFQNGMDLSFLPALISVMTFITTFSYDEYNKWDAYAITMPIGKKNIVRSKYLASLILVFITTLITLGASLIIGHINNNLDIEETISIVSGSIFAVVILLSIMFPLIFKFGIEKSRIGIFSIIFIATTIGAITLPKIKVQISKAVILFLNNYLGLILITITILAITISYKISKKIYLKKEF